MVHAAKVPMLGAMVSRGRPSSGALAAPVNSPPVPQGPVLPLNSVAVPFGGPGGSSSPVSSLRAAAPQQTPAQQQPQGTLSHSKAVVRNASYTAMPGKPQSAPQRPSVSFTPLPAASAPPMPRALASWTPPAAVGAPSARGAPLPLVLGAEAFAPLAGRSRSVQPPAEEDRACAGLELELGEHRFLCLGVLGRGSYSEVWRARPLGGGNCLADVALKEVRCSTQTELQQAIFEVQVLLALERSASQSSTQELRVPQCITYKVDPCDRGWKVRTAMTVVPGEALDLFIRRSTPRRWTRLNALRHGCTLAAKLISDIAPMLMMLSPIAWHRDVNSHNILIDAPEGEDGIPKHVTFWLIDFGLAVDSQSWVTAHGKWRTEYIGGDSRYWPPSSWIMHLLGPEGFAEREHLCEQYQHRLDIHGLGITALELLCMVGLAAPQGERERLGAWEPLLEAWQRYRDDAWRWWSMVYRVFSTGGDIAPVQAQLVQDGIIEQLITLLANIRQALRHCAGQLWDEPYLGRLLLTIAEMLDEGSCMALPDLLRTLEEAAPRVPQQLPRHGPPTARGAASAVAPQECQPSVPLVRTSSLQQQIAPGVVQEVRAAAAAHATSPLSTQRPGMVRRMTSPVRAECPQSGATTPTAGDSLRTLAASRRIPAMAASCEQFPQVLVAVQAPERARASSPQRPLSPVRVLSPLRGHSPVRPPSPRRSLSPLRVQAPQPLQQQPQTRQLSLTGAASVPGPGLPGALEALRRSPRRSQCLPFSGSGGSPEPCHSAPAASSPPSSQLHSPRRPCAAAPSARTPGHQSPRPGAPPGHSTPSAAVAATPRRPDAEALGTSAPSTPASGAGTIGAISALATGDLGAGPPRSPSRRLSQSQEALRARIRCLEASSEEHERLRERIRSLEDSLQRLGRESLERAKIGMEKLAEKYFPKVKQYEEMGLAAPNFAELGAPPAGQRLPGAAGLPASGRQSSGRAGEAPLGRAARSVSAGRLDLLQSELAAGEKRSTTLI